MLLILRPGTRQAEILAFAVCPCGILLPPKCGPERAPPSTTYCPNELGCSSRCLSARSATRLRNFQPPSPPRLLRRTGPPLRRRGSNTIDGRHLCRPSSSWRTREAAQASRIDGPIYDIAPDRASPIWRGQRTAQAQPVGAAASSPFPRQNPFMSAAPMMGPVWPCCKSTAQLSAPGRMRLARASSSVTGLPLHLPTGIRSRTTL
jgi:hypothetical protein